jgi:transketolase
MSVIDILNAIYSRVDAERIRQGAPGRDRVFLSKGHAAAGLYATLWHYGLLREDPRERYCREGAALAGHASHAVAAVEHSTGALGHGLPVAVGCALGLRAAGRTASRVYVVVGDGEIQEGSNWEALMLARHHRLDNLIVIVDANGISSSRRTSEVIDLEPMAKIFTGFGFAVGECEGVSGKIEGALDGLAAAGRPAVLIARTVKGQGIPFAEGQPIWHYRSLDEQRFGEALQALDAAIAAEQRMTEEVLA